MFEDIVPHWVRHFTRKVINLFDEDALDPGVFNIKQPKASLEKRSEGIGYTVILTVMVVVYCFLLTSGTTPY